MSGWLEGEWVAGRVGMQMLHVPRVCSDVNGRRWRDQIFQLQDFISFRMPARVYALCDSDCGRSMCQVNARAVFARNPAVACNTGVSQALHSCTCAVSGSVSGRRQEQGTSAMQAVASGRIQTKCSSNALSRAPPLTSRLKRVAERAVRRSHGSSGSRGAPRPAPARPTLQLGVLAFAASAASCQLPTCLSLQPLETQGLHQNTFSCVLG